MTPIPLININGFNPNRPSVLQALRGIEMRYDDEIAYNLAREKQELALSRAPGDPATQAIHREMARLYGSLARDDDFEPVPNASMTTRI